MTMRFRSRAFAATAVLLTALLGFVSACGSDEQAPSADATAPAPPASTLPVGDEPVTLDPANFTTEIDNPYWPMTPGHTWVFRETDGQGEELTIEVTVTDATTEIMGITARVVHDVVTEDGKPVEVTDDWYAQDRQGNIWYLGEATQEYENGRPTTTAGSWVAGVAGAQAGIALPADLRPGLTYRQEYLRGKAEDRARVLDVGGRATVPAGMYGDVLVTEDSTPLEPDVVEHKYYAKGVGPIRADTVSGGTSREELLEVRDR
jgi:hypothetical protein